MIVLPHVKGWEVTHHRAHALLAAQLAYALHPRYCDARFMEVIEAIAFHDDGQLPFDGHQNLNAAGAPLDFRQRPVTLQQAERVAYESQFKSRRVALLISMHLSYLYEPLRQAADAPTGLNKLCLEQRQKQKEWCRALGLTVEQANKQYDLVRWADQFSLAICCNLVSQGGFLQEVGTGPGSKKTFISKHAEGHYYVKPWPFAGKRVEVFYESRVLTQLAYTRDEELLGALQGADVIENVVILEGMM